MNKFHKAIKYPGQALRLAVCRCLNLLSDSNIFAHSREFRSDSENESYGKAVVSVLKSQKAFDNFKRNHSYREILEHVSAELGRDYLDIVRERNDGLFEKAIETVLVSDDIGNPVKCRYNEIDLPLSPTTLRYLKVASDLRGLFGNNLGRTAEIGCGYGGQTYVNDQLLSVDCVTLFDLPFVNKLIERYLNTVLLNGAYRTTVINQAEPNDYDLAISNYAFSELPSSLQCKYIEKVLAKSKRGYLTMNSGLSGPHSHGKLSLEELRELMPKFEVYEEEPLSSPYNYIVVWGHNELFANKFMTLKVV